MELISLVVVIVVLLFAIKGLDVWLHERKLRKAESWREAREAALADRWGLCVYSRDYLVKMRSVNNADREQAEDDDEWGSVAGLAFSGFSARFLKALERTPMPRIPKSKVTKSN